MLHRLPAGGVRRSELTSAIFWLSLLVLGVLSGVLAYRAWHGIRLRREQKAILHAGSCEGEVLSDQWAIRSKDGLPAVAMSRMVLIDEDKAIPLTNLRTTRVSDSLEREGSVS